MTLTKPPRQRFRRGLLIVTITYTALMVFWTIALWLPIRDQWLLQGTAIIGSWFYAPLWLLFVLALLDRRPQLILLLLIPLLFFAHDYAHLFWPRWPTLHAAQAGGQTVRVMSWNSYFRNQNGVAFLTALQEIQPDIVAIQEWGEGLEATTSPKLQELFPYQVRYPATSPAGMALLSRYPIVQSTLPDFRDGDGCNCLVATIDLLGQPMTLISTHPWPPQLAWRNTLWSTLAAFSTASQDATFDVLLQRMAESSSPLLLLGDFNTTERQRNYRRVTALLRDAFAEAGWGMGYTFPTVKRVYGIPVFPVLRLDYIFHDQQWQTQRIWRGTIDGSDHRYIVADLVLGEVDK